MSFTFQKSERLCSKKIIEQLFEKDISSFNQFPFRFSWLKIQSESKFPIQVLFIVSSRNFPKATQRNRIKRRLRELYRLEKNLLYEPLQKNDLKFALMVAFISKEKILNFVDEKKIFHKSILRLNAEFEKNNQGTVSVPDKIL